MIEEVIEEMFEEMFEEMNKETAVQKFQGLRLVEGIFHYIGGELIDMEIEKAISNAVPVGYFPHIFHSLIQSLPAS